VRLDTGRARQAVAAARASPTRQNAVSHSRWSALVVAVLLLFCWQTSLTQTHVHFEAAAGGGSAAIQVRTTAQFDHDNAPSDRPENCPICRAAAQTHHYLSPAPIAIPLRAAGPVWQSELLPPDAPVLPWSHAWRSRGPPSLQA
jgi:hypothetical protein